MSKPRISFFDMKGKVKFEATDYRIEVRGPRKFAVTKAPSGCEAWRVLGKDLITQIERD